jgi:hypothetical protein
MKQHQRGQGWITFAGTMVTLAGFLNALWGIAAIGGLFQSAAAPVPTGLQTWGWIVGIVGVLELAAAYSIFRGGEFGRWFGILIAAVNAASALMSIKADPAWGICLFAIDVLIIYALATYGGRSVTS